VTLIQPRSLLRKSQRADPSGSASAARSWLGSALCIWTVILTAALLAVWTSAASQAAPPTLQLVQTIPLPGVEGRIDHLTVDLVGQRLFVAALGNNTLEVVDLRAGRRTSSIPGMREPQGVAFLPDRNRIIVANGGDGRCAVVDGATLQVAERVPCGDDADNVRHDRAADVLYVGAGRGWLTILGGADAREVGRIPLQGHPEAFVLEPDGHRIFVNVPTAGHVEVVDRARRTVTATWPVSTARANFPMAIDPEHRRLFVGCRQPARLLVYDLDAGRLIGEVPIAGDVDDLAYDAASRQIYASGGEGAISVVEQVDADHYRAADRIPTASGARTALFVPELRRLYVAVPHRGSQAAEIRAYAVAS
jgi:DNA-binding beta-propeller fold protein YncE